MSFVESAALYNRGTLAPEIGCGLEGVGQLKHLNIVEGLLQRVSFEETSIKVVLTGGVSEDQLMPEQSPIFFAVLFCLSCAVPPISGMK